MLKVSDLTFTHDIEKKHKKELLYKMLSNPCDIIDFTFPIRSFMLSVSESTQKQDFKEFDLGEIKGNLRRKDLYEDK